MSTGVLLTVEYLDTGVGDDVRSTTCSDTGNRQDQDRKLNIDTSSIIDEK